MGLFGTGSYKVMSIWPPRLLQLCFGGQIIVKTNPHKGVSHTSSHTATQPISSLLSTLFGSDSFVQSPEGLGFRMSSRVPTVSRAGMQFESHLGHANPLVRGGFRLCARVHTSDGWVHGLWPGRRGGLCGCVGGGFRSLAGRSSACCGLGSGGSSFGCRVGLRWANTCSWLWAASTT
jgi:hypothetical protein